MSCDLCRNNHGLNQSGLYVSLDFSQEVQRKSFLTRSSEEKPFNENFGGDDILGICGACVFRFRSGKPHLFLNVLEDSYSSAVCRYVVLFALYDKSTIVSLCGHVMLRMRTSTSLWECESCSLSILVIPFARG